MTKFPTVFSVGISFFCLSLVASAALSQQINTAEENGAYHRKFCPQLQKALSQAQFNYECSPSKGSRSNIEKVSENAAQIGFAQLDLYALEKTMQGGKKLLYMLRDDIAKECLFLVSKNPALNNFGQIAAQAEKLEFVLPPKKSGHVGTFHYLQQIDPHGLGQASRISYAVSADEAISKVLESDNTNLVTMFVEFPDPSSERFKTIPKKGGRFIPVIDRKILRQDIGGEKVYFAEDTQISNPKWMRKEERLITACTPIILFTGNAERISNKSTQKDHEDLIRTIEALPVADLQPQKNFLSQIWNQTKSLSAKSVDSLMDASDKARKAASPMMEKAKDLSAKALEASEPIIDKAKEVGSEALEQAEELAEKTKEEATKLMDKSQ